MPAAERWYRDKRSILGMLIEQIENLQRSQTDAGTRAPASEKPLMGPDRRIRLSRGRPELNDRLAAPGDDDFLAAERLVDQLRKTVLGVGNAVLGHGSVRLSTWPLI